MFFHNNPLTDAVLLDLVYSFNGWGVTVVDSMDTMYLMGLHKEFNDAVDYVSTMTFDLKDVCTSQTFYIIILSCFLTS